MSYQSQSPTSYSEEGLLSWRANQTLRSTLISQSGAEPVTVREMKEQLAISLNDTTHDVRIDRLITAARQKYEYDTSSSLLASVYEDTFDRFYDRMRLIQRLATAITSITYFDDDNASQTLGVGVYQLDTATQEVRLQYDQEFPNTISRFDAVKVRYSAGYSTTPETAKQAIILLASFWFEVADMIISPNMIANRAYESLVAVHQRSTYP